MLESSIINFMDTFNIIYLWIILTKKDSNPVKLISIVFILSILVIINDQLGINFIITYILDIMTIKIIYKTNLKEVTFEFFLVLLIELSLQSIITLIINKFVYNNTVTIIIIQLITFIGIIIFSKINLKRKISFQKINGGILIYFILTCSVYAIGFKVIWNYDKGIILNNLTITSVILTVLVISQILAYLYIVKIIKEKEILKVSNECNLLIKEIVEEIKQRQHDFVNYKNTIRGIVEVVDDRDVKAVINDYIKDEDMHDNKINELIYIDNVVVKSIIYRNICKAQKHDVNFSYEVENNVLDTILNYYEISNVLNNLLNNAFDEVMKEQCTNRNIEIKIFNDQKASHLIIKNQLSRVNNVNISKIFTRGYSTKNTKSTRGYGLHNVKQIINSHEGNIKMNVKCGEIIFDIYFNNS